MSFGVKVPMEKGFEFVNLRKNVIKSNVFKLVEAAGNSNGLCALQNCQNKLKHRLWTAFSGSHFCVRMWKWWQHSIGKMSLLVRFPGWNLQFWGTVI